MAGRHEKVIRENGSKEGRHQSGPSSPIPGAKEYGEEQRRKRRLIAKHRIKEQSNPSGKRYADHCPAVTEQERARWLSNFGRRVVEVIHFAGARSPVSAQNRTKARKLRGDLWEAMES